VDREEACLGPRGVVTQYKISFQTGSVVTTESVNLAGCTARKCRHAFKPPRNALLTYANVTVAAENRVGVGATKVCTEQAICELI